MKHLRKFNESNVDKLEFDDFKEIILIILDDYNYKYSFIDCSVEDDDFKYYDCQIEIYCPVNYADLSFYFIADNRLLPPFEDPLDIKDFFDSSTNGIDSNLQQLEILKSNLDIIINTQKDLKKIINDVYNIAIPRFKKYDEFLSCNIGYDRNQLRITYEINTEL